MRRSMKLSCVVALGGAALAITTGSASAAPQAGGKSASCTPKKHFSRWTDVKGSKTRQFQTVTVYPKGSGRIAVGGFCHVNAKGLGKRHKIFRDKPVPKHVTPPVTPPATVVGDPVTIPVANPAPPIATPAPPITTPVTPPVVPPASVYTCDNLVVTGITPGVTAQTAVFFTATNGAKFNFATFDWGDSSSSTSVSTSDGQANGAHPYLQSGRYTITATVEFILPDGSTPTATSIQCQKTVRVRVPVPRYSCDNLVVSGLTPGITAQVAAHFTALNGAVFDHVLFSWGDTSSDSTDASANNEADFAHTYAASGQYSILATLYFRVPGTTDLQTSTCSTVATVL